MKKSVIYYFSGTGNTEYVSELLGSSLKAYRHKTSLVRMEDVIAGRIDSEISDVDYLGLAFPIYGLGAPSIVADFIDAVSLRGSPEVFICMTGADYIGLNHNASSRIVRKLEKLGAIVNYERIIVMPSNFLIKYPQEFSAQLIRSAEKKAEIMAGDIDSGRRRRYHPGFFLRLASNFIHFLEGGAGARSFGKNLIAGDECTLCGLCTENCPRGNIKIENGLLKGGTDCLFCMRCIYSCPNCALSSRGMGFIQLKEGYRLVEIIRKSGADDFITAETRGFYRHFYRYLNNSEY